MVLVASKEAVGRARVRAGLVLALLSPLGACGTDLGECDPNALGGSLTPPQAMHTGQMIVGTSCSGSRCHAESATGEQRFGAPAELNFDVISATGDPSDPVVGRGGTNVIDWADEMWEQIESGTMPPPLPKGGAELSAAQKEAVRNWLACGAEVITPTNAPVQPTWDSIWPRLSSCTSCHATASSAGQNFVLGMADDMCGALGRVREAAPITMACGSSGIPIVVPNDPDGSLLVQKLKGTQTCGDPMPYGSPMPFVETAPDVVAAIETWIAMGAPKPASCP
jgi:hypothetical protein